MPIVVIGSEKNFAALRPRLYAGRLSAKAARELAAAIRAANPHADLDRLEPGTVLTIPDAPNLKVRGELSLGETLENAIEGLSEVGTNALEHLVETAKAREAEAAEEREQLTKALESKELEAAASKHEGLAADLDAVRKRVAEENARAGERAALVEKAQSEWSAELEALKGLLD